MSDITISAGFIEMANVPRAPAWLYIYAMSDFWLADRTPVSKSSPYNYGVPYMRVALAPTGTNPTRYDYASFVLPSTEDALINPGGARWGIYLFDANLRPLDKEHAEMPNLSSFRVPSSPSTNNLTDIAGYNTTSLPPVNSGDAYVAETLYATHGVFSGNVTANAFFGNGAGLTGIGTGTGGVINTGSTTIGADSDSNADGIISLQTRTLERLRIDNDGAVNVLTTLAVTGIATLSLGASIPGAKQLSWTTDNVAAPSALDNTVGSRIKLYNPAAPNHIGLGLESGAGWFNAGDADSWKWYYAAVHKHTLTKNALTITGTVNATSFSGIGTALTALNASNLDSGTVPLARLSGILNAQIDAAAAIAWSKISKTGSSLADLATRSAADLSSGTLPDARFPATLPAASGVNLTALSASNLSSGTVPDARFPATLPALSGANLTSLNGSNISSGTVAPARLGSGGLGGGTKFLTDASTFILPESLGLLDASTPADGALPLFLNSHTLGNSYLKQTTDMIYLDGTGSAPQVRIYTNGLQGDASYTRATLYADANMIELRAEEGGTFVGEQNTVISLNSIGVGGEIHFKRADGILWRVDPNGVLLPETDAVQNIGSASKRVNSVYTNKVNGVKVYRALLTQSGTAAPTATVLENSLGGTVVWTRVGPGDYWATLTGAFPANKVQIFMGSSYAGGTHFVHLKTARQGANDIQLITKDVDLGSASANETDDLLSNTEIRIEVNP